jgi:UDPglucose 6-dehydrogenase
VGKALKLDKRIGQSAYVIPGLGFAGGTLPRDLRVLQKLGQTTDVPTQLVDAVLQVNENTTKAIAEIVQDHIRNNKLPKTALILGYTYKADTNTLRRSLSLSIAEDLRAAGIQVFGLDPMMNDQDLTLLKSKIDHVADLTQLPLVPSVTLLMTARPVFLSFDWGQLIAKGSNEKCLNAEGSLVLDTQNFLDAKPILAAGINYKRLWSSVVLAKQADSGGANATR